MTMFELILTLKPLFNLFKSFNMLAYLILRLCRKSVTKRISFIKKVVEI